MQAFVADQSGNWAAEPIGAGDTFTVIGAVELPPGSWIVLATVALASSAPDSIDIQTTLLLDGAIHGTAVQSNIIGGPNRFLVIPLTTGLALDHPQTLQIGCRASQSGVASQPSTITVIQVESVARIRDQYLGGPLGPATGASGD